MAEGNRDRLAQHSSASDVVNITNKNGVILMLERYLEYVQDLQKYLMSERALQTLDPNYIKKEHYRLTREQKNTEIRLQMAREEAQKRATQAKDWDVGSKMNVGPRALDYVQFADRGYQVTLFATNCQGEITKRLSETCLDNGQAAIFVENFVRLVQEDDRFYPVPAMKHILEAICSMAERERNHKAWKIGKSAEEMLDRIEESRSRKRMNAS